MPLSEEELRLLEQMERALVEEDPKFASTLRGTSMRRSARRRATLAGLGLAIGIAVLMTGAITNQIVVGVLGFVLMLGSATLGLAALRGQQHAPPEPAQSAGEGGFTVIEGGRKPKARKTKDGRASRSSGRGGASRGSFMQRMESRWRRRRDSNGF